MIFQETEACNVLIMHQFRIMEVSSRDWSHKKQQPAICSLLFRSTGLKQKQIHGIIALCHHTRNNLHHFKICQTHHHNPGIIHHRKCQARSIHGFLILEVNKFRQKKKTKNTRVSVFFHKTSKCVSIFFV